MNRNSCLICSNKKLGFIKIINGLSIVECRLCDIAITKKKYRSDTKYLYSESDYYLFDQYNRTKKYQLKKIYLIKQIVSNFVDSGNILEIGAGFGLLSKTLAKNLKYKIQAIEPFLNLNYAMHLKNVNHISQKYELFLENSNTKFECVLMIDVLEHFSNPDLILTSTTHLMKDNGVLIINLPNYKSLMAKIVTDWSWWMVDDHYYHFSPKSIKKLLVKNGFEIEYISTYESLYDFKKNLDGNFSKIKNSYVRKLIKAVFYILFFSVYIIARPVIWKFGYGGLLIVVARIKKDE